MSDGVYEPLINNPPDKLIYEFKGEYRYLSNFYSASVKGPSGLIYPTVEHAYQASKSDIKIVHELFVYDDITPGHAKKMGREIHTDNMTKDWDKKKEVVMLNLLINKFSPRHQELMNALIRTDDRILIEGNSWGDRFWGVDIKTGIGKNRLGELIMTVRDLRKKGIYAL